MKKVSLIVSLLFSLPLAGCGGKGAESSFASVDSSYELLQVGDELTLYVGSQEVSIGYDVLEPHLEVDLQYYGEKPLDELPLTGNVFFSVFLARDHTRIYHRQYDSGVVSLVFRFAIKFPESPYPNTEKWPDALSSDLQPFYRLEGTSYVDELSSFNLDDFDFPPTENGTVDKGTVYYYPEEYWLDCSITIGSDGRILSKVAKPESMVLEKIFGGIL